MGQGQMSLGDYCENEHGGCQSERAGSALLAPASNVRVRRAGDVEMRERLGTTNTKPDKNVREEVVYRGNSSELEAALDFQLPSFTAVQIPSAPA